MSSGEISDQLLRRCAIVLLALMDKVAASSMRGQWSRLSLTSDEHASATRLADPAMAEIFVMDRFTSCVCTSVGVCGGVWVCVCVCVCVCM